MTAAAAWGPEYTPDWYARHTRPPLRPAARALGRAIAVHLSFNTLIDVGCGVGALLEGVRQLHAGAAVAGFDHPEAVRRILAGRLWLPGPYVPLWPLDLERQAADRRGLPAADVAVCTEVAEHLDDASGAELVRLLAASARTVVWSAAIPGQGGEHHVNERPAEYWERRFADEGFRRRDRLEERILGSASAHPDWPYVPWYSRLRVYAGCP